MGKQDPHIFIFTSESRRRVTVNKKGRSAGPSTPGGSGLRQPQARVAPGQGGPAGLQPRRYLLCFEAGGAAGGASWTVLPASNQPRSVRRQAQPQDTGAR